MFLRILYLVDSISSEIVWIDKLHYFHEGIYFPNNGCHGNREKGNFLVTIAAITTRKKSFIKNLNLIDSNYHCENWVDWISAG